MVRRDDIYLRGKLIDLKRNKSTVKPNKASLEKESLERDRVRKEERARERARELARELAREDKAALKLAELRKAITDDDNLDDIRKKFQVIAKHTPVRRQAKLPTSGR